MTAQTAMQWCTLLSVRFNTSPTPQTAGLADIYRPGILGQQKGGSDMAMTCDLWTASC